MVLCNSELVWPWCCPQLTRVFYSFSKPCRLFWIRILVYFYWNSALVFRFHFHWLILFRRVPHLVSRVPRLVFHSFISCSLLFIFVFLLLAFGIFSSLSSVQFFPNVSLYVSFSVCNSCFVLLVLVSFVPVVVSNSAFRRHSFGALNSLPNIRNAGVFPVAECIAVLCANWNWLMYLSHLCGLRL